MEWKWFYKVKGVLKRDQTEKSFWKGLKSTEILKPNLFILLLLFFKDFWCKRFQIKRLWNSFSFLNEVLLSLFELNKLVLKMVRNHFSLFFKIELSQTKHFWNLKVHFVCFFSKILERLQNKILSQWFLFNKWVANPFFCRTRLILKGIWLSR